MSAKEANIPKTKKDPRLKKTPSEDIANRLKKLRDDKLTLSQVAEMLQPYVEINLKGNIGRSLIYNLESQNQNLTIELAIAYSKVFDASLEYILCLSEDKQPENKNIKEVTRLSDTAIDIIKDLQREYDSDYYEYPGTKPLFAEILNSLYENGFMTEMVRAFGRFLFTVITLNNIGLWNRNYSEEREIAKQAAIYQLHMKTANAIDDVVQALILDLGDRYMGGEDIP